MLSRICQIVVGPCWELKHGKLSISHTSDKRADSEVPTQRVRHFSCQTRRFSTGTPVTLECPGCSQSGTYGLGSSFALCPRAVCPSDLCDKSSATCQGAGSRLVCFACTAQPLAVALRKVQTRLPTEAKAKVLFTFAKSQ